VSVLVAGGQYAKQLAGFMASQAPDESFVLADGAASTAEGADVLLTLLDDPAAVVQLMGPSVRWVHVLGTGVDGFPFEALGDRILTCSRGAAGTAIAEWVLAMMLLFEKQLPESFVDAPPKRWNIANLGGLDGRTLGVVGLGGIGQAVATRALPFGMSVVAHRRTASPSPLPGVRLAAELGDVLAEADHVVVAAPATPATAHLIDADSLRQCKRGVHLINVARGSLVDQEALRVALDDGTVARASLDTVEPEPLPEGHWLYTHPKVRLSPHISWSSASTMPRTIRIFLDNLAAYRKGGDMHGVVDPSAGY